MATIETQDHPLRGGGTLAVSRSVSDGEVSVHKYWLDPKGKLPGATTVAGHVDAGGFGAGMGWAEKVARANDGDIDAPKRLSDAARDEGTRLHDDIDTYISSGRRVVAETNPLFVAWLHALGDDTSWVTSERFVVNSYGGYGGTIDAISIDDGGGLCIWDWKTVAPGEEPDRATGIKGSGWRRYGSRYRKAKDSAQLAAYACALRVMDSTYAPTHGRIGYVLRDGSEVVVEDIDLEWGWELFKASLTLYGLRKGGK
jgi:hypothetical protein